MTSCLSTDYVIVYSWIWWSRVEDRVTCRSLCFLCLEPGDDDDDDVDGDGGSGGSDDGDDDDDDDGDDDDDDDDGGVSGDSEDDADMTLTWEIGVLSIGLMYDALVMSYSSSYQSRTTVSFRVSSYPPF